MVSCGSFTLTFFSTIAIVISIAIIHMCLCTKSQKWVHDPFLNLISIAKNWCECIHRVQYNPIYVNHNCKRNSSEKSWSEWTLSIVCAFALFFKYSAQTTNINSVTETPLLAIWKAHFKDKYFWNNIKRSPQVKR